MSYRVTIEIVCDQDGCDRLLRYRRINRGGLSKTRAGWKAANEDHWDIGGSHVNRDPTRAFCPDHRRR